MARGRRNHLPRKSSPDGIKARQEIRIKAFESAAADVQRSMRRPGSSNRRKIGRL